MPLPFYFNMIDNMTPNEFKEFQETIKNLNPEEKQNFLKQSYKNFKKKDWNDTQKKLDDWIEKIFQK